MSSQRGVTTPRAMLSDGDLAPPARQSSARQRMRKVMERTPVAEVMARTIPLASPDASVGDLEWLFCHQDIDAVLVVQDERRLVGVVTKSDLIRGRHQRNEQAIDEEIGRGSSPDVDEALGEEEDEPELSALGFLHEPDEDPLFADAVGDGFHVVRDEPRPARAAELMSSVLVVAEPGLSLAEAMALMASEGVSCLPVVERRADDELVGMISAREVIHWLARQTGHLDRIAQSDLVLFDEWGEEGERPPSLLAVEHCMACKPRCLGC